jgi:hypothetical protein
MSKKSTNRTTAINNISLQVGKSAEEQLMFAVIKQAINNAGLKPYFPWKMVNKKKVISETDTNARIRNEARNYLRGDIFHANIIGLDPQWIRETMQRLDVTF